METKLHEINVTLSRDQKQKIFKAFIKHEKISLYLKNDALYGNDTLLVPSKSIELDLNLDLFISNKAISFNSSKWFSDHYILTKDIFSEMLDNGFILFPSTNDKSLGNFRLYTPPTVVEMLEEARKNNIPHFEFVLDYSLLTKSYMSTAHSVFENIVKIMEN